MDIKTSLKQLVSKKGLSYALQVLSSENLSEDIKVELSNEFYLIDGYPNVELISSLA